jgi:hypothetical protein
MSTSLTLPAAHSRHVQLDRAMIYCVLAAGTMAGMSVSPTFWLVTPPLALGLIWASRRAAPPKFEPVEEHPNQLPMRVELAIHDTVAKLPSGDARRLLGDVVRQARPLFGLTSSHFDKSKDDEAKSQASTLVLAACETALELSHLDTLLAADTRARGAVRDAELKERLTTARTLFAERLTDAATALTALYASGVEHGTPASHVVAELAGDLSADAIARTKARLEMDELLS